jgi:hypothetical protein
VIKPPEVAGTSGQFSVTAMRGVVVSGQVAVIVSVTVLPLQLSLAVAVTMAVTEQALLLGTV